MLDLDDQLYFRPLVELVFRLQMALADHEAAVDYFKDHYVEAGLDAAYREEIKLYILLEKLLQYKQKDLWLREYEACLQRGIKPRRELVKAYEFTQKMGRTPQDRTITNTRGGFSHSVQIKKKVDCIQLTDYGVQARYPFNLGINELDMLLAIKNAERIQVRNGPRFSSMMQSSAHSSPGGHSGSPGCLASCPQLTQAGNLYSSRIPAGRTVSTTSPNPRMKASNLITGPMKGINPTRKIPAIPRAATATG